MNEYELLSLELSQSSMYMLVSFFVIIIIYNIVCNIEVCYIEFLTLIAERISQQAIAQYIGDPRYLDFIILTIFFKTIKV